MSTATDVGGPTPKQTPYGRLTNFNTTARYTLSIKRDGKTAYLWLTDQDVRGLRDPIFVYDGDILYLEANGPGAATDYFTVQRLNSDVWTNVTNIGLANYIKKRRLDLTITGTADTSTIAIAG